MTDKRIEKLNAVKKDANEYHSRSHVKSATFEKIMLSNTRYLSKGVHGKVFKSSLVSDNNIIIAHKHSLLSKIPNVTAMIKNPFSRRALGNEVMIEFAAGLLLNQLVLQNVSPHFMILYDVEITKKDLVLYFEYINGGTIEQWAKTKRPASQWFNAMFQIMAALYVMMQYFNMSHTDLHANNVMFNKVKPGGYWKYIIDGNEYIVPNLGYVFYIIDYGRVWIPGKMQIGWYHRQFDKAAIARATRDVYNVSYVFDIALKYLPTHHATKLATALNEINSGFKIESLSVYILEIFGGYMLNKPSECSNYPWFCYAIDSRANAEACFDKKHIPTNCDEIIVLDKTRLLDTYNSDKTLDTSTLHEALVQMVL